MSDPIFLRNSVSSSIYAEQMNSAQIQGQAAAREKAIRARQEALKAENAMIQGLEDSAKLDVRDQKKDKQQQGGQQQSSAEGRDENSILQEDGLFHIDLTV